MWGIDVNVSGRVDVVHRMEFADALIIGVINDRFDRLEEIMATNQSELNAKLTGINTALTEAGGEIVSELDKLRQQLADAGNLTPENEELLNSIGAKAQALADIVPNAPTEG